MAYTVRPNDTLKKIAAANGLTLSELIALNPQIANPDVIQIGQTINLAEDSASTDTEEPAPAGGTYTVVGGDTLNKIAAANGITLSELLALNPKITNPDRIQIGQIINLPGGGDTPATDGATDGGATPSSEGGGYDGPTGMPTGGTVVRVNRPGQENTWAVIYEFPAGSGTYVAYNFDSKEQMENILGPDFGGLNMITKGENWFTNPDIVIADVAATEIAGLGGSFSGIIDDIVKEAAIDAGIQDPSLIGQMAADPEMQAILAAAALEDWSPARILAEQRNTDFWKNVLYPGIEAFYGQTQAPEQAYRDYVDSVTGTLSSLGYGKDADGTYKSTIKAMLEGDVDATTFVNLAPTYVKASQNETFRLAFDEWASRELGRNVTFDDWFDLLAGEGEVDIALAAEAATIEYLSQDIVGEFLLDDDQIRRIATERNLTESDLRNALAEVDASIAGLMGSGMEKYGLTNDDILSARTGISSSSGRNLEEINRKVRQALVEGGLADEAKIDLYTAYNASTGTPNRPGLLSLAPEGA